MNEATPLRIVFLGIDDNRTADGGARIREFHLSAALAGLGDLDVFAFVSRASRPASMRQHPGRFHLQPARRLGRAACLSLVRGRMYHESRFDYALHRDLLDVLAKASLVVFTMPYAARYLQRHLATAPNRPRVVWDTQNYDPEVWAEKARVAGAPRSWIYKRQAAALPPLLTAAHDISDMIVACTERDRSMLLERFGDAKPVEVIPNGAETERFRSLSTAPVSRFEVLIGGNLGRDTNAGGALWFLKEVWPLLVAKEERASLTIAGRSAPRQLRKAVDQAPNARLVANPPDMFPIYESAHVVAMPQLYGVGSKIKLFESLASGRHIVASPVALHGVPPELSERCVAADSPDEWAHALIVSFNRALPGPPPADGLREIDWDFSKRRFMALITEMLPI